MADVRISTHVAKTQKNHEFVIIRFYEGLENLIGTNYVIVSVDGERLYFIPSEVKVKGSLKLTPVVNVWKQCNEVKSFEGEYSLDYDTVRGAYYIDKHSRISEINRIYGNHNVPHTNYKAHTNEPYVDIIKNDEIATSVTVTATPKVRKYSMVVYDGLLELLRVQISDLNKTAVNTTLNTIKSLIGDE